MPVWATAEIVPPPVATDLGVIIDGQIVYLEVLHEPDLTTTDVAEALTEHLQIDGFALPYVFTGVRRDSPVTFHYSNTGAPADYSVAIRDGAYQWNGYTPNFEFVYGGVADTSSSICITGGNDGINSQGWRAWNMGFLAVACWGGGGGECDVSYNTDYNWALFDIRTVSAHENGHCLGLGHSTDPTAIMYFQLNGTKHQILPDDLAGLCAIYGCDVLNTPTPVATPTNTGVTPVATVTPGAPTPTSTSTPTPTNSPTPGWTPTFGPTTTRTPIATATPFRLFVPGITRDR